MYDFNINDFEILETYKDIEDDIKVCKVKNLKFDKPSPDGIIFKDCVLKIVKKNSQRHIKEGSVLKELQECDKIVKCYGWCEKDNNIYIFIEYINGITLKDYIIKHKDELDDYKISEISTEILKILEFVHKLEIIHRDLSYTNVMFDYDNQCWKLIDFGMSYHFKGCENGSKYFSNVGTINYKGPEVLTGNMKACRKSDIWSFGCLVILLLGGSLEIPTEADGASLGYEDNDYDEYEPKTQTQYDEEREMDLHPIIPEHAHPFCKNFIKKCFFLEPQIRFDPRSLISHPFITYFGSKGKQNVLKVLEDNHKIVMDITQKKKGIHINGKEYTFKQSDKWSDIPSDTVHLKFGPDFNEPIPDGVIPNTVKILDIGFNGGKFNHPLVKGKNIPNGLVSLVLGNDYSYDIDPSLDLQFLSLGKGRKEITHLPCTLETFKYYGSVQQHGLGPNVLPPNIINLYLFNFDTPIKPQTIPPKVKLLVLFNFNHIDSLIYLPPSIDDLRIQCSPDVEKTIKRHQIPNHISLFILNDKVLDIRENDDQDSLIYLKTIQ